MKIDEAKNPQGVIEIIELNIERAKLQLSEDSKTEPAKSKNSQVEIARQVLDYLRQD